MADRTCLILASTGEVLNLEDRLLESVSVADESLNLILVPRELEAWVVGTIVSHSAFAAQHGSAQVHPYPYTLNPKP